MTDRLAQILQAHQVAPGRLGSTYGVCQCGCALHEPIWIHQAGKVAAKVARLQAETLRDAADGWGDGQEGFPYAWLNDRADELESGKQPDWSASW